ncbi:MAG: hypothetical protein AAFY65_02190 [Pseudomonadota bacterium]
MLTILRPVFLSLIIAGFLAAAVGKDASAETVPIWSKGSVTQEP